MADGFAQLDERLARTLASVAPAQRRRIARKIGMALRKANAKRIADNVQPDGAAMEPRKPRKLKAGKGGIKRGRMFRKLRLARNMKVKPTANGVSVGFEGLVAHAARAHQYGLTDFVGRTPKGDPIRTRYAQRVLIGFTPEDRDTISDIVLAMLDD